MTETTATEEQSQTETVLENKEKLRELILSPGSDNGIITSLTQTRKSSAIIEVVEICVEKGISVIISSDNRLDQQDQLYNRFLEYFRIQKK